MARIAGVDLPREKRAVIGLTYIYGIGKPTSQDLLAKAGISEDIAIFETRGFPRAIIHNLLCWNITKRILILKRLWTG